MRIHHFICIMICACSGTGDTMQPPGGDVCGNAVGNGATIIAGPSTTTPQDSDRPFHSLTIDPQNADLVYLGTERNGIVKSRDGGRTWERLRNGLRHSNQGYAEVYDLAVAPTNRDVVVAATADSPGPVVGDAPSTIAGVYRSSDGGSSWVRINCGLNNASTASVRVVGGSSSQLVLGVSAGRATFSGASGQFFTGGLLYSSDGGNNWQRAAAPAGADSNQFWIIREARGTGRLFTTGINRESPAASLGLMRSDDQGRSWTSLGNPQRGRVIQAFDVSADGQTIWADADDTFHMLRSTDGGNTWVEVGGASGGPLAMSPTDPARMVFADFNRLYYTANALGTSTEVVSETQAFDDVEFAPSDPNIVYAVSRGYNVYRSVNGGAAFTLMSNLRATVLR